MTDLLERRSQHLGGLARAEPLDVLVVGGGINGVGVLLDAVTRGLSAALVERDDLAVGTSSRSSKLIHGGLRYLEHLDFGLVREALRERDLLVGLAPHLVTLRRFAVPVVGGRWQLPYIGSGLTLYDLLGGRKGGRFETLSRAEIARRLPHLDPAEAVGGFEYTDGVCDDARFVVAVAETARRRGAGVLTQAEARTPRRVGDRWEVAVVDRLGAGEVTVRARSVVDVTGAFEADSPFGDMNLTASRGVHLVVAGVHFSGATGLTVRVPGRVVFVIPWGRRWLIGTTDEAHDGPIDRPSASTHEVDYLLDAVNEVLAERLERSDVIATFAGVRPLAGGGQDDTVSASREHTISHDGRGLVSVRGGKYTTYRLIAAEVVDEVCSFLGVERVSVTERTPLVGAASPAVLDEVDDLTKRGLSEVSARWLVGRHGVEAAHVLAVGTEVGMGGLLHPDMPYLEADAWWAIHREGALTLDDVLARRTRLAIETADHGLAAAPLVARLLGDVHGWAPADVELAVATYAASAEREYGVP
ncbi:glycerol-3-phosphate dehydrogenase [soil metagenome]